MKKFVEEPYDGYFLHDGKKIFYRISDNNNYAAKGKMSRGITFYYDGRNLGYRAIYGPEEDMQNISPADAERWYVEALEKKWI